MIMQTVLLISLISVISLKGDDRNKFMSACLKKAA
ncbi:hypothetical protein DOD88_09660 [Escherichia coli]|nr:hypothetical protein [Escherichia coli]